MRFAVAGVPINHSLSPELFALVAEHLGLKWYMPKRVNAATPDELFSKLEDDFENPSADFKKRIKAITTQIKKPKPKFIPFGDKPFKGLETSFDKKSSTNCFVSVTTPLKHQFADYPVNLIKLDNSMPLFLNSDGLGFVEVARHFNIFPEKGAVLGLNGGGSTALATAIAWKKEGGYVNYYGGNRKLKQFSSEVNYSENDDIFVDYDNNTSRDGIMTLNPKYGTDDIGSVENNILDGTWLLVAQHLIAWSLLARFDNFLPSIGLLITRLKAMQNNL